MYLDDQIEVLQHDDGNGYVSVNVPGFRVYSYYHWSIRKHTMLDDCWSFLSHLEDSIRQDSHRVVVVGVFDAHSPS